MPAMTPSALSDLILAQIAAESYLDASASGISTNNILSLGNNNPNQPAFAVDPRAGDLPGKTRMVEAQITRFNDVYTVVDHLPNTWSGFSGTLLWNKQAQEYVLSFRSTEFQNESRGGDFHRDGIGASINGAVAGADNEIATYGFAVAQAADAEAYFRDLKARGLLQSSENYRVTGYSLGGHLATVFAEAHADDSKFLGAVTFNSPGRGQIATGTTVKELIEGAHLRLSAEGLLLRPASAGSIYEQASYIGSETLSSARNEILAGFDARGLFGPGSTPNQAQPLAQGKIEQVFGLADTDDSTLVANRGIHSNNYLQLFIEDQPGIQGLGLSWFDQILGLQNDFATTHSITLIADSLGVAQLLQAADSQVDQARINSVLATTSNQRGVTLLGTPGLAESDSLERMVEALAKLYGADLSAVAPDGALPVRTGGGTFGDLTNRKAFWDAIGLVRTEIGASPGGQLISFNGFGASALAIVARNNTDAGLAYRYALIEGNSFAIIKGVSFYESNGHLAEKRLDLYSLGAGGQLTDFYIDDRAAFLERKTYYNVQNARYDLVAMSRNPGDRGDGNSTAFDSENIIWDDRTTQTLIRRQEVSNGSQYRRFGSTQVDVLTGGAATDRLYAGEGNDLLQAGQGSDRLEGGLGRDIYLFSATDGEDTILDTDGKALVIRGGKGLALGIEQADGVWSLGGTTYTRVGADIDVSFSGSADRVTLKDFDFAAAQLGRFAGIRLIDSPAATSFDDPLVVAGEVRSFLGDKKDWDSDPGQQGVQRENDPFGNFKREDGQEGRPDSAETDRADTFYGSTADEAEKFLTAGGDDVVFGDGESSAESSSGGRDLIEAGAGRDSVRAGAGNDWVEGGDGGDLLWGNRGDDAIYADTTDGQTLTIAQAMEAGESEDPADGPADLLSGDEGDDVLIGAATADFLAGGAGADVLVGGGGDDTIYADGSVPQAMQDWTVDRTLSTLDSGVVRVGTDNLTLTVNASAGAADMVYGGAGRDWVVAGAGNDWVEGGADGDLLWGNLGDDAIYAETTDGQTLTIAQAIEQGESGAQADGPADLLSGDEGNDVLIGAATADFLAGGIGADLLVGGAGNDTIYADDSVTYATPDWTVERSLTISDSGVVLVTTDQLTLAVNASEGEADTVYGGAGEDWVFAGAGDDFVDGGAANDVLLGDSGSDVLMGGMGDDVLDGDSAEASAAGLAGDDYVDGGAGNDKLFGEGGADVLAGGDDADELYGGDGDDILIGGAGQDSILRGGAGKDTYVFNAGDVVGNEFIDDVPAGASSADASVLVLSGVARNQIKFGLGSLRIDLGDDAHVHVTGFSTDDPFSTRVLDSIQFDDGQVMTFEDVLAQGFDLDGTEFGDLIDGTAVVDRIDAKGGNDFVFAKAGNDTIVGGAGNDLLDGGLGDDLYLIGFGDGGDEVIDGGGTNVVRFGEGITAESLVVVTSFSFVYGASRTSITYGEGDGGVAVHNLGIGAVASFEFAGGETLSAEDIMLRSITGLEISGTHADETVYGTNFTDTADAGDGADTLLGHGGDDSLSGNAGADVLVGGTGSDVLSGGEGDDRYELAAGDGVDAIEDTVGVNTIRFGAGIAASDLHARVVNSTGGGTYLELRYSVDDRAYLRDGISGSIEQFEFADGTTLAVGAAMEAMLDEPFQLDLHSSTSPLVLYGSRFDDRIIGSNGVNMLSGNAGNDALAGGAAADSLYGGAGDDLLVGGGGSDVLEGGEGADVLQGDGGDDQLSGGAGHDTYRVFRGMGKDLVLEAAGESSSLRLLGVGIADLAAERHGEDLYVHLRGNRDGVLISGYYADSTEEGLGAPSSQAWQILDGSNTTPLADWLGATVAPPPIHSLEGLIADYEARARGFYESALIQSGYAEQPGGEFLRVVHLEDVSSRFHAEYRVTFDTEAQPDGVLARLVPLFDESYSSTTVEETRQVEVPRTDGSSFADGGYGYGQFVATSAGAGGIGQQVPAGTLIVPVFGPGSYTDPITGQVEREIIGYRIYPPDSPAMSGGQVQNTTQTVTHFDTQSHAQYQLNLARIAGSADDDNGEVRGWTTFNEWTGFNVVDAGLGNDTVDGSNEELGWGQPAPTTFQVLGGETQISTSGMVGNLLYGNAGDDLLRGGSQDDVLVGGAGADVMYGGLGNDRYVIFMGDGNDTVLEDTGASFDAGGDDILVLSGVLLTDLELSWGETQIQSRNPDVWLDDVLFLSLSRVESVHTTLTLSWGTTDSVRIVLPHAAQQSGLGIDFVTFADGTQLSMSQLVALAPPTSTLDAHEQGNVLTGDDETDQLSSGGGDDVVAGGAGDDWIYGGDGNDTLSGGEDDDLIHGGYGADIMSGDAGHDILGADVKDFFGVGNSYRGGTGQDFLLGSRGSDLYLFEQGDGQDVVGDFYHRDYSYQDYPGVSHYFGPGYSDLFYGGSLYRSPGGRPQEEGAGIPLELLATPSYTGADTIRFGEGITAAQLEFVHGRWSAGFSGDPVLGAPNALVIGYGTDDLVELIDWYSNPMGRTSRIEFSDGTFLDAAAIAALANDPGLIFTGTAGDDVIVGARSNDTLSGLQGNDVLAGGLGDDTYMFNLGDGVDRIEDVATAAAGNSVQFGEGITEDMLWLSPDGMIHVGSGGDAILLAGFDPADPMGTHAVDRFVFANGSLMYYGSLINRGFEIRGTPGDDELVGTAGREKIQGYEGHDILTGNDGADWLEGGEGNDLLSGGDGDDTLVEGQEGNNLIEGGAGNDYVYYEGHSFVAGGTGDDWIDNHGTAGVIAFNRGDGHDTIHAAAGFTLSLGGGVTPADLSLSADGDDLILALGEGDTIRLSRQGEEEPQAWPEITLQLFGSVHTYDFHAVIGEFYTALAADPSLTEFALGGVLQATQIGFSTSEAFGGALAYQYAASGTLGGLTTAQIRQYLAYPEFGVAPQAIAPGGENHAPVVFAADATILFGATAQASALFSVTDEDGTAPLQYEFWDSTAGNGHWTVNGVEQGVNVTIAVDAADLATTSFVGASANAADLVWVRANDGEAWSQWKSWTINSWPHLTNAVPVVRAANAALLLNDSAAASTLFSVSDADGDAVVQYEFWDDSTGGGYFSLAGVAQSANPISVTAAQLDELQYVAGAQPGTEQVWVRASDGMGWSVWKPWNMTSALHLPNAAPEISAQPTQTVLFGYEVDASALFTASDADGDPIQRYELWDSTEGNGRFEVGGVVQGVNTAIAVDAAQLASTRFVGASSTGSDLVWVRASDGQAWGDWKSWTMNSWPHAVNAKPVADGVGTTILTNAVVSAESLFTVSDGDGDAIAQYEFWDDVSGGGYWRVGGIQQAAAQAISVTAAGLAQTEYVGGASGGTERVWVRANDGLEWGAWESWDMTTALHIPNAAPEVSAASPQTLLLHQSVEASALFSVTDADGDAITHYEFWDSTAGNGRWTVNGVEQGVNVTIAVDNLADVRFVGAPQAGSDVVWVRANDGQTWSNWKSWNMQSWPHLANAAPVASASNGGLLRSEAAAAADLFSVSDADGDSVTQYQFWDDSNGGGYWRLNGVQQAAGQNIDVTAADLPNLAYVGGANAGTEQVWVRASDGLAWGAWKNWLMSTEGGMLRGGLGPDTLSGEAGPTVLEGGGGDDTLTDDDDNNLFSGGGGDDQMTGGDGNDLFAGGSGDDTVQTGGGANVIAFNDGSGLDTVFSAAGATNTLSLGGGIGYNDLSLSKNGNDLVLNTNSDEGMVLKDWYAGKDTVQDLQLMLDATEAFDAESSDPLYNRRVQTFDFRGLVNQFDQALAQSPGLTSWALTNALLQFHLSGSDDSALGGDLAYWYGKNGNLTGIGLQAAQQVIGAVGFGSDAQALRPFTGLQDGFVKLS